MSDSPKSLCSPCSLSSQCWEDSLAEEWEGREPGRGCDSKGEVLWSDLFSDKLKLRKMFRKKVSQSGQALSLSSEELDRLSSSVLLNILCLLRNEGVPSFRLCASLFCEKFRRSEGGLTTFRKRFGHSRKDGFPNF